MWDLQNPTYQAVNLPFIFNLYLFELLLNTIIISVIFNFLQLFNNKRDDPPNN